MIYLMSTEVGRDDHCIGFPSVETCLAVVVQTTSELIGWHSFNTLNPVTFANAATLRTYIEGYGRGDPVHLYGATNLIAHPNWRAEMRGIAAAIGYHGRVTVFDIHVTGQGSYVEFRRSSPTNCQIFYKRNQKMQYTTTEMDVVAMRQRRIVTGSSAPSFLYGGDNERAPIYTQATVNPATSRHGALNQASWMRLSHFDV